MLAFAIVMLLFATNVSGWNIYLYVRLGSTTVIVAASHGVSHNAVAPSTQLAVPSQLTGLDEIYGTIEHDLVHLGPVRLFAERRLDWMQPVRLAVVNHGDGYVGFELPLLLIAACLGVVAFVFRRRSKQVFQRQGRLARRLLR